MNINLKTDFELDNKKDKRTNEMVRMNILLLKLSDIAFNIPQINHFQLKRENYPYCCMTSS